MSRSDRRPSTLRVVLAAALPLLVGVLVTACASSQGGSQSAPAALAAPAGQGDAEGGPGPQILTADLLARQEVRADKIIAHWTIVGTSNLRSVTINGETQTFEPGDTATISKQFILKISQTVITVTATDSKNDSRELTYLIVNPGLPIRETEAVAMAPQKLPLDKGDQTKLETSIKRREADVRKLFAEGDFSDWGGDASLNTAYNNQVRSGQYPIWMESRVLAGSTRPQFRAVYRALPVDAVTHRAYWGLTPRQYNFLIDDLSKRGYQQVFREVLSEGVDTWRVQTVWILKFDRPR